MLVAVAPKQDAYNTLPSFDVNVFLLKTLGYLKQPIKRDVKLTNLLKK